MRPEEEIEDIIRKSNKPLSAREISKRSNFSPKQIGSILAKDEKICFSIRRENGYFGTRRMKEYFLYERDD